MMRLLNISFPKLIFFFILVKISYSGGNLVKESQIRYDNLRQEFNKYRIQKNDSGKLAWESAYYLQSLVFMAEATSNTKYLELLRSKIDETLLLQDKYIFPNSKSYSWSSKAFSIDKETLYKWPVHTGMILLPITDFLKISVRWQSISKDTLQYYLSQCVEIVNEHECQWHPDGYFTSQYGNPIKYDGVPFPMNMQLSMGLVYLNLYHLTGDSSYFHRVKALARLFKRHCYENGDGTLRWYYATGKMIEGWNAIDGISFNTPKYDGHRLWEDFAHGTIDVLFAIRCYLEDIEFDKDFINRLGNTFINAVNKDLSLRYRIFGLDTNKNGKYNHLILHNWLFLCIVNSEVWEIGKEYFEKEFNPNNLGDLYRLSLITLLASMLEKDG